MKRTNPVFSFIYSCIFGAISAFAGFIFSDGAAGREWGNLYVYTGLGGFIGGYLVSSLLIVKPNNYSTSRLVISGFIIGFVSPYFCFLILGGLHNSFDNETVVKFLESFINLIFVPAGLAFVNLFFFGWLIIPLAISTLFFSRFITTPSSMSNSE
jgi:hypothetical protein|tara:strand:- start:888 stop:1352 length:465 start_codon:yes stop_codon:yes gene_type:complete